MLLCTSSYYDHFFLFIIAHHLKKCTYASRNVCFKHDAYLQGLNPSQKSIYLDWPKIFHLATIHEVTQQGEPEI